MDRELKFWKDECEYYRNQLAFLEKYGKEDVPGLWGKLSRFSARMGKKRARKKQIAAQRRLRRELEIPVNGLNSEKREVPLIVSLTSFPARISFVPAVVGSLLRQTCRPDRILLYLAGEQFSSPLPEKLTALQKVGLEIRFVEDLRPHKKYFFAMQEYPDAVLVTVDDDVLYAETFLEELYASYRKFPEAVSCMRAHKFRFDEEGNLKPYFEWILEYNEKRGVPSANLIPTGCGGVLYPPRCFSEEAFDRETIRRIALSADDLWLKVMCLRMGRKTVLCGDSKAPLNDVLEAIPTALAGENFASSGNDEILKNILAHFSMRLFDYMDDEL